MRKRVVSVEIYLQAEWIHPGDLSSMAELYVR